MASFMKNIIQRSLWGIYRMPLWSVALCVVLFLYLWTQIVRSETAYKPDRWRTVNRVLFVGSIFAVAAATLFYRTGDGSTPELMPFHFIKIAATNSEAVRAFVMNVVLFIPFGVSLPFVLRKKKQPVIVILSALVLSVAVECAQYFFSLGKAETDDVIANTLGAVIGLVPYIFAKNKLLNIKEKKS